MRGRSYIEDLNDYENILLKDTKDVTKVSLLVNTFFSIMFVNSCENNQAIELIICHKDYTYTMFGKPDKDKQQQAYINFNLNQKMLSDEEKKLKTQILNREQQDILKTLCNDPFEQTIFRNSHYKRIMYTFNLVQFTLTEDERKRKPKVLEETEEQLAIKKGEEEYDYYDESDYEDSDYG